MLGLDATSAVVMLLHCEAFNYLSRNMQEYIVRWNGYSQFLLKTHNLFGKLFPGLTESIELDVSDENQIN